MKYSIDMIEVIAHAKTQQRRRDLERARERAAKYANAFDASAIDAHVFDYDDSFVHDLRESLTRYAIAH